MVDLKATAFVLPMLFILSISPAAIANENPQQHKLVSLYHYSGVHSHLSEVHATVSKETELTLNACSEDSKKPDINRFLSNLMQAQSLKADYIQTLGDLLTPEQVDDIINWANSPVGLKVHQIEAESSTIDESKYETLLAEYRTSSNYTVERSTQVKTMLAKTGAVFFVSALNTESSALVSMASLCQLDADTLALAQSTVRSDRGEEGLIRAFLRSDLLMPASVVYRSLSDDEFDAFNAFSESDSGKAYYKALVQSIRIVLSGRVDRLEQQLETMLVAD